ncbi:MULTISPECIES: hypothetical protein [Halorussus]|uniref:hypothetical protein n=1 Tax=Halorussus TaxID=1070314 RepID=UPI00209FA061|nr:hypothetical protein [Halorussus vallis]USZ76200.1 hypothetical protein NGM07_02475 [Halorussus vallis]
MSEIVVGDVRAEGERVTYEYACSPDLRRFFADDFFVEYDVDVSDVPESLLAVPLVANLCPVAWATGADVYVPTVDATFFRSLRKVRRGFERIHPELATEGGLGEVYARNPVATRRERDLEPDRGSAMLFSGGVDSVTTYLRHREEDPTLVSVHGFDIGLDQNDRWTERQPHLREFARRRDLDNRFVRTNMQQFLDLVMLNAHFGRHYDDNWITSVHHGLGLLGACAPLSVTEGFDTLYIAATHSEGFEYAWGSHPATDDEVAWADTTVEHDAYELTRQQKLYRIADYVRVEAPDLELRTCSLDSENCGECEKCVRTEVGLLLAGLDPVDHGYPFEGKTLERARDHFEEGDWHLGADERFMWRDVQTHAERIPQDDDAETPATGMPTAGAPDTETPDSDVACPVAEFPYPEAAAFFEWLRDADIDALAARSSNPDSTDSPRNRAVYAVARRTPYPVYAGLATAYSHLAELLAA